MLGAKLPKVVRMVPGPDVVNAEAIAELGARPEVVDALKSARSAWPNVQLTDSVFLAYAVERLSSDGELDLKLFTRSAADMYLACACAHGDAAAIATFEKELLAGAVEAACRRSGGVSADDLRQRVSAKLFVGPPPKIASFAGRSSLRTWLRAVVGRLVIDASRERPRDVPTPDNHFVDLASAGDGPDGALFKRTYREALEEAFLQAAERLSDRDKNLLRYGISEGLNIDQIGHIYGVHRVTAARWLQQARAAFVEQVQAILMDRLKLSASEFESVVRMVISQVDVTIARVFA